MSNCEACDNLRDYAPNFLLNGVTDTECGSLQKNTGLNPNLSVLHKNCEDLHDVVDCLIGAYADELPAYDICGRDGYSLKDYIAGLMKNLYNVNEALVCSDCGQWIEIEKIYEIINAISGGEYTWLTPGVDYNTTFYNGFYTNSGSVRLGIIEASDRYFIRIERATNQTLENDNIVNVEMRHTTALEDAPKSRIFGIKFIGNYAKLESARSLIDTSGSATGIWNILPLSYRASWNASVGTYRNTQSQSLLMTLNSYADGYNDQFSRYASSGLSTSGINCTLTYTLLK